MLTDGPGAELAGAAATGDEAVELARQAPPDVVVMDLHMPGMGGVEATRRILADRPDITVLVLTLFDDDNSIAAALRAGARHPSVGAAALTGQTSLPVAGEPSPPATSSRR